MLEDVGRIELKNQQVMRGGALMFNLALAVAVGALLFLNFTELKAFLKLFSQFWLSTFGEHLPTT